MSRLSNRRKRLLAASLSVAALAAALVLFALWRARVKAEANRERAARCRAYFATLPDPPRDFLRVVLDPTAFDPGETFAWPEIDHIKITPPSWKRYELKRMCTGVMEWPEWPEGFRVIHGNRRITGYAAIPFQATNFSRRREPRLTEEQVLEKLYRFERLADPDRPASINLGEPHSWWYSGDWTYYCYNGNWPNMVKFGQNLANMVRGYPFIVDNAYWMFFWQYHLHGIPLYWEKGEAHYCEDLGLVLYSSGRATSDAEPPPPNTVTTFTPTEAELEAIVVKALDEGRLPDDVAQNLRYWLGAETWIAAKNQQDWFNASLGVAWRSHSVEGLYYINNWLYLPLSGDDSVVEGRAWLAWKMKISGVTVFLSPDASAIVGVERPEHLWPTAPVQTGDSPPETP